MRADLGDILSDLETLSTEQAFKKKFERTFAGLGFNSFTYVGFKAEQALEPRSKRDPADAIFLSNVSSSWIDHYLEEEFQDDDPLINDCFSNRLPLVWNEKFRANARSQRESRVLADALDFGIRRGMTIPLHGPGGELGIMSLYSDLSDKAFAGAIDDFQYDVHLISLHFHDAVQRALAKVEAVPKPIPLTEREVEILQWTAIGKTAWEIGSILKISERTVNFHLQNAMTKFGVHNKTHAAAKAMSAGLLSPKNAPRAASVTAP
jgi:DNA-binding CsgD family transcriptional regulator